MPVFPVMAHPLDAMPNGDQFGLNGVPIFTAMEFIEVLKITRPVAGRMIAFCWAVVMRGIKNPVVVLLTSSMALVSALLPVELIETFWPNNLGDTAAHKSINSAGRKFFIGMLIKFFDF